MPSSTPTPTPNVSPTPKVFESLIDYEYYLIARKDGLYCVGETIADGGQSIYPGPRLWIPWPLQKGQSFHTFIPFEIYPEDEGFRYTVDEVDGSLHTDAGDFDKVGFFVIDDAAAGGYLRGAYGFRSQFGIVDRSFGQGRGNFWMSLTELDIRGGGNQYEARMALAVGNRWKFDIIGGDSLGDGFSGNLTEEITGRRIIRGENAFVLTGSGVRILTDY